jgi:hypothetical protein
MRDFPSEGLYDPLAEPPRLPPGAPVLAPEEERYLEQVTRGRELSPEDEALIRRLLS